jgi:hypothetical protein
MERPTEGCCGNCAYLSRRSKPSQPGGPRAHSIFAEVEPHEREQLRPDSQFVPGEANSWQQGEFGCFAHVADLPKELLEAAAVDSNDAAERVIWKDRHCPRWSKYEPGVAPREQLQELKARAFEQDRRTFEQKLSEFEARQVKRERRADRRLTVAAIWLASIIGLAQLIASLLTMSSDSVAYRWFNAVPHWCLWRLFR